jgi:ATP/maltotriose-dependent transcriptional regulator MalT
MLVDVGRPQEALRLCAEALTELNAMGDSYAAAFALNVIGVAQLLRGNPAAALEAIDQACDLQRRLGDFSGAAVFENSRVWVLFLSGQITEARALAERNKRDIEKLGFTWLLAEVLDSLSLAQMLDGDLNQAQETIHQAFALPDVANKYSYSFLFSDLALVLLAGGGAAEAQRVLDEAPPPVGVWAELERLLIGGAVAWARGDAAATTALAALLAERAAAADYQLYVQRAARLVEAIHHPPPLAEFPRFLWVDQK